MDFESIQNGDPAALDTQARLLYAHYGARPWTLLPEATREHVRSLVRAGLDGQGLPAGESH
ncbi:hypothetical protein ACVGOW_13915 [Pseudonocardia saturnea]